MKNKRGQFYLVAAIIIVLAIAGISSVSTYASIKSEPKTIYDLSSDLKTEYPQIINYGVYNGENITDMMNDFVETEFGPYFLQKTDNANVIFVYGNQEGLYNAQYHETKTGGISIGGVGWSNINDIIEIKSVPISGSTTEVTILDKTFTFKLRENEMFYFIMIKQKDGEIYIEQNE